MNLSWSPRGTVSRLVPRAGIMNTGFFTPYAVSWYELGPRIALPFWKTPWKPSTFCLVPQININPQDQRGPGRVFRQNHNTSLPR